MSRVLLTAVVLASFVNVGRAEEPAPRTLHADLVLDQVIGVRLVRVPDGDHSSPHVRTFVSHNPEHFRSIDQNLRQLPPHGQVRGTRHRDKARVRRRVVLTNGDGREVSLMIYDDYLRGTFENKGPAAAIISAIKTIETESDRRRAALGRLPVIDAVVKHAPRIGFSQAAAHVIKVGSRVRIDLADLIDRRSPVALLLSDEGTPDSGGALAFPSAMSCERVRITYRGKIHDAGYRLLAQMPYNDQLYRMDVLVFGRQRGNIRYEITIRAEENSFVRGFMQLSGRPASTPDNATSKPEPKDRGE